MVDSDYSVNPSDFLEIKAFMKEAISHLNVMPHRARIGIVSFSTQPTVEFYLNDFEMYIVVKQAIDKVRLFCWLELGKIRMCVTFVFQLHQTEDDWWIMSWIFSFDRRNYWNHFLGLERCDDTCDLSAPSSAAFIKTFFIDSFPVHFDKTLVLVHMVISEIHPTSKFSTIVALRYD